MKAALTTVSITIAMATSIFAVPAAAQTNNWRVAANTDIMASGDGAGGTFDAEDHRYTCNGTVTNCAAPTVGAGAPPVTYTHSDTQTSALLSASAQGSYPSLSVFPGGSASGSAYAYADLATGTLHIADSGDASGNASTTHREEASFVDTLHFTGLTASTTLDVHIHLDGTFLGDNQPNLAFEMSNGASYIYLYQDWGDSSATIPACIGIINCSNVAVQPLNTALSPGTSWTKLGEGDYVGQIAFDPLHPNATVQMGIAAGSIGSGFDDFSHTAGITFDLPSGVGFTSASGAFLTAAVSAVPEPATWAMMVVGFGLAGGAMRRGRGRNPQACASA